MTLRFALDLFNVNTGKKHSGHGLYQDGDSRYSQRKLSSPALP